nr:hypothetical protein [Tanacetum cinerariifolium]
MDVRRIEEEVDPDFLSDAHSRTGSAESGDSCESKNWCSMSSVQRFDLLLLSRVMVLFDFCSLIAIMGESLRFSWFVMFLLEFCCHKRELVVKYKAEKVCHEEMVKMPLVDLKMFEYKERYQLRRPVSFGAYRDESVVRIIARAARAAEEREVSCEAQQGRSRVKRKLFESFRNNMGNEPILALPEGSDNFVVMRGARVRMLAKKKREGDVRTLIMKEAHATKYSIRPGVKDEHQRSLGLLLQPGIPDWKWERERLTMDTIQKEYKMESLARLYVDEAVARHEVQLSSIPDRDGIYIESERTFWTLENMFKAFVRNLVVVGILTFHEAEIRESKMIRLEMEQEITKVVVIKERLKEAKDRQERVKLILGNQTFRI